MHQRLLLGLVAGLFLAGCSFMPNIGISGPETATVNQPFVLSVSDSSDQSLGFTWEAVSYPAGSYVSYRIEAPTKHDLMVTPELAGTYVFRLTGKNTFVTKSVTKSVTVTYGDGKIAANSVQFSLSYGPSFYTAMVDINAPTYFQITNTSTASVYRLRPVLGVFAYNYQIFLPDGDYSVVAFTDADMDGLYSSVHDLWDSRTLSLPAQAGSSLSFVIAQH